jgi:hypothetical protein
MQTLDRPTLLRPGPGMPSCEQVLPGNVDPEADEGHIGGTGPAPQPLQGDAESPEATEREGFEGDGT